MAEVKGALWRYIIRRLVFTIITLLIILTLFFWLFEALPLKAHDLLRLNPQITPSQIDYQTKLYGYDKPSLERYFLFMKNMLTFNFGISFHYLTPVHELIQERLPRTLLLLGGATIIAYALGVLLGAIIAWRRGGVIDKTITVGGLVFYNMPVFWLGLIFIYIFAFMYGLFPLSGFYNPESGLPHALDVLHHSILPMTVLALISLAGVTLLMRTSMLDVLRQDYMTTAVAKGLKKRRVVYRHGVRNALLPIVTSFILAMVFAVGGAVITEQVFSYQGIGQLYIESLIRLDYPVCQATLYLISLLVLIGNFIADVLYGILDPRVRLR